MSGSHNNNTDNVFVLCAISLITAQSRPHESRKQGIKRSNNKLTRSARNKPTTQLLVLVDHVDAHVVTTDLFSNSS